MLDAINTVSEIVPDKERFAAALSLIKDGFITFEREPARTEWFLALAATALYHETYKQVTAGEIAALRLQEESLTNTLALLAVQLIDELKKLPLRTIPDCRIRAYLQGGIPRVSAKSRYIYPPMFNILAAVPSFELSDIVQAIHAKEYAIVQKAFNTTVLEPGTTYISHLSVHHSGFGRQTFDIQPYYERYDERGMPVGEPIGVLFSECVSLCLVPTADSTTEDVLIGNFDGTGFERCKP
jgi:hypothetical protein